MNSPKITLKNYNYTEAVTNELRRLNSDIITVDNVKLFEKLVHPLQGIKQIFKWSEYQSGTFYQQCSFRDYYTHMWLAIRDSKDVIILCKTNEGNVYGLEYHKEGNSYVFSIELGLQIRTKTAVIYNYTELSVINDYFKLNIGRDYCCQWENIVICQTDKPHYNGWNVSEMFSSKLPPEYKNRNQYVLDILECEVYEYNN